MTADATQLKKRLLDELEDSDFASISRIIAAAAPAAVFAVGGTVRDLLLQRPLRDIDLCVEGDAIAIVPAALPNVRLTTHRRFGTVGFAGATRRIDVAGARAETYARPGALPTVRPAAIEEDLRRRDFTVNAMALPLSGTGAIVDPCGGMEDLARRQLRALHDGSFVDDPTRIYRAFRYAARLAFQMAPATSSLVEGGLRYVPMVSAARLRRELELMLGEPEAGAGLQAAHDGGALAAVHGCLSWDGDASQAYARFRNLLDADALGFALLTSRASKDDAASVIERLRLRRHETQAVEGMVALRGVRAMLERPDVKPSGVVLLLERYPLASVAAFAAMQDGTIAGQVALRYLGEWRHVRPLLRGNDLQHLGVPAGPQIERGLKLIRAARLDGWAGDAAGERDLVLRYAASIRDSGATQSPRVRNGR